jgi:hypothetical protein
MTHTASALSFEWSLSALPLESTPDARGAGDRRHFFRLLTRLRALADGRGDAPFVRGLTECIAGTRRTCPIATLLRAGDERSIEIRDFDPRRLFFLAHQAARARAIVREDAPYVDALARCRHAVDTCGDCPMRRRSADDPLTPSFDEDR